MRLIVARVAALIDPRQPMPSYDELPRGDRDAIVAYLGALRGEASCLDGGDCG